MSEKTEWLSGKQVAELLGISFNTINGWIYNDKIPFDYYPMGGKNQYKKKDILDYIDRIKVTASKQG